MSSMLSVRSSKARILGGLSVILAIPYPVCAQDAGSPPSEALVANLPRIAPQLTPPVIAPAVSNPMAATLSQWTSLRGNMSLPFKAYADFLLVHKDWPGEAQLRRTAERTLRPDQDNPATIVRFFSDKLPESATGWLRYAEALAALNRHEEARLAARKAWTSAPLTEADEARLLQRFGGILRDQDHDDRMDRFLWLRATEAAARHMPKTSPLRRPNFDVRLALLTKSPDAPDKLAFATASVRNDPGFIADYMWWLRNTGQGGTARQLLRDNHPMATYPASPEIWLQMLLISARDAAQADDWQAAFDIARRASTAYPPNTEIRKRPFAERDTYTDLTWLAATVALNRLNDPSQAAELFRRYALAAQSPQTQARGLYWAGRAWTAASRPAEARRDFEEAAKFVDQFHGQLAVERLGQKLRLPPPSRSISISPEQRAQFEKRSVVQALLALGEVGNWNEQSLFVRSLASTVSTDADHVLAAELAQRAGRPDLSVLVGRNVRNTGLSDYIRTAFPKIDIPADHAEDWTIIHAITRQESQFDRQAVSRAGARGLMQLMPGTARDTARRLGMDPTNLALFDPQVNIPLGASYFRRMLNNYGGSHVLAIAAYNAGPGNVNRWLRSIGDPRTNMDVLDWIEAIPFSETRNYVQRVLENAVVYGLKNPDRAATQGDAPLSFYLGKSYPG
ncbi:MAG: hypothetical protein RLZZ561_2180 [Pseudomonadota bacterium]